MITRRFPKCGICGTHGHYEGPRCPLYNLNREQELAAMGYITPRVLFPGRPDLIAMLENVQRAWGIKYGTSASA